MKITKLLALACSIIFFANLGNAQTKIAHINSSELMEQLPEVDSIEAQLTRMSETLQKTLTAIEKELQFKEQYWKDNPTKDPEIIELRQQEYQDLVSRYQRKQQEAQKALSEKQDELLAPVLEKVKNVIQQVAKEKGYSYVLDSSEGGGVIYSDPSHDLLIAVKAKLGVK